MSDIVRWNPLSEMAAMRRAMDRVFEDTWRPFFNEENFGNGFRALALDMHEDDDNYTITTEMPGVKAENIHISLDGDMLTIEGEIPETVVEKEGTKALVQERHYGKFSRRVRMPHHINAEKVESVFTDGVLTLTLPKAEEAKPKLIPVKTK